MAERKRKESGSASARERTGTPARRRAPARAKSAAAPTEAAGPAINESEDAAITQASKSDIIPELTPFDHAAEHEEIARLAYAYYEARGGEGGSAEEDWLRAEQELRRRRAAL